MNRYRAAGLSIIALGALPTLVAAQSATSPQADPLPVPSATRNSPGSPLSPQTQSALKLAGLVTFVANSCPGLKPNYPRFKAALDALGVAEADLNNFDLKGRYLGYTARYNADAKASCQRARAQFGPQGSTLPDIFQVDATNAPPRQ